MTRTQQLAHTDSVLRDPRWQRSLTRDASADGRFYELEQQFSKAELVGGDAEFERWVAHVVALVEEPQREQRLPLDIPGTAFQERVWKALRRVGPGQTLSYAELAQRVGAPHAIRAVASACATNRVAMANPCHRMVRTDGGLSGYRWGVERKRKLLQREAKA
jgi:AraC family transcriptional regulator, regulatory protein of adaptative response / methylated-DNA-[protein]-cysteine methyltransferase